MTTLRDEAVSEIHQFISLVRARIAGALQAEGTKESEPERLWRETYGQHELSGGSTEELMREVGAMLTNKLNVASLVVIHLAMKVGDGRDLTDILDEVESELTEQASR